MRANISLHLLLFLLYNHTPFYKIENMLSLSTPYETHDP